MGLFGWLKHKQGVQVGFTCLACGRAFKKRIATLYCDLGTMERQKRGEKVPYSEMVVPERVICPRCRAVDQFELDSWTYLMLLGTVLKMAGGQQSPDSPIQFVKMSLADGTVMHPLEAREWYAQQVAERPQQADLRVKYGNVLRTLGYQEEAEEQYHAALEINPGELEALVNRAVICGNRGDSKEGYNLLRQVVEHAPSSKHPQRRGLVRLAQEVLQGKLKLGELSLTAPLLPLPASPRPPGSRKRKRKKRRPV